MTSSSLHKNQLVDKNLPFLINDNACTSTRGSQTSLLLLAIVSLVSNPVVNQEVFVSQADADEVTTLPPRLARSVFSSAQTSFGPFGVN